MFTEERISSGRPDASAFSTPVNTFSESISGSISSSHFLKVLLRQFRASTFISGLAPKRISSNCVKISSSFALSITSGYLLTSEANVLHVSLHQEELKSLRLSAKQTKYCFSFKTLKICDEFQNQVT